MLQHPLIDGVGIILLGNSVPSVSMFFLDVFRT